MLTREVGNKKSGFTCFSTKRITGEIFNCPSFEKAADGGKHAEIINMNNLIYFHTKVPTYPSILKQN